MNNEEKGILLPITQLEYAKFVQRNFYSFRWSLSCLRGILRKSFLWKL